MHNLAISICNAACFLLDHALLLYQSALYRVLPSIYIEGKANCPFRYTSSQECSSLFRTKTEQREFYSHQNRGLSGADISFKERLTQREVYLCLDVASDIFQFQICYDHSSTSARISLSFKASRPLRTTLSA